MRQTHFLPTTRTRQAWESLQAEVKRRFTGDQRQNETIYGGSSCKGIRATSSPLNGDNQPRANSERQHGVQRMVPLKPLISVDFIGQRAEAEVLLCVRWVCQREPIFDWLWYLRFARHAANIPASGHRSLLECKPVLSASLAQSSHK